MFFFSFSGFYGCFLSWLLSGFQCFFFFFKWLVVIVNWFGPLTVFFFFFLGGGLFCWFERVEFAEGYVYSEFWLGFQSGGFRLGHWLVWIGDVFLFEVPGLLAIWLVWVIGFHCFVGLALFWSFCGSFKGFNVKLVFSRCSCVSQFSFALVFTDSLFSKTKATKDRY